MALVLDLIQDFDGEDDDDADDVDDGADDDGLWILVSWLVVLRNGS